jgi:hypothetical protein
MLVSGFALVFLSFAFLLKTSANGPLSEGKRRPAAASSVSSPSTNITVTNNLDSGPGSLRDAIDQANTNPGADTIDFTVGVSSIDVGATTTLPLPNITDALTINGGATRVELIGSNAGEGANGLTIQASGVTVRGLVINRFEGDGISIAASNCIIQNNFIGTDAAGAAALPNFVGISLNGTNNLIGGTSPVDANVISGNDSSGIELSIASNNTIQGNFIGTDSSGSNALPNAQSGIRTIGSPINNVIGGTVSGARNTIKFNSGSGVNIFGGSNNSILGNSIFGNGGVGINLSDDPGVTPNDMCDLDTGANELQNFPTLTSATSAGGVTNIVGIVDSTMNTSFRVEFFSSPSCDTSGNGQGETFIGAATISTPVSSCVANINVNFAVSVPGGSVITATATDPSNNTSEFSPCITVAGGGGLTCPSDLFASTKTSDTSCGTVVTYSVLGIDVSCLPPSGSVFPVGSTTVTCENSDEETCSFNVFVVDGAPPRLNCSTGVAVPLPAGSSSAVVNYPAPTAFDECGDVSISCAPPSGSTFPPGATLVTCSARDSSENTARCFFFVSVLDAVPPVISCPGNVSVSPPAGQTSAVVTYPPPTVTDNLPGVITSCAPASGSTFPQGITTVTCTATDTGGNRASCSFTVGVGGPQVSIIIPGGKPTVDFSSAPARKVKPKNTPCSPFTIENTGFSPLVLTLDSIVRTGTAVDSGRITDPNDTRYFSLNIINADQSLTPLDIGGVLNIPARQSRNICVKFAALVPALAGKTTGLAAANVLPDTVTSRIVFRQNAGANISVPLSATVATAVVFVNISNPRALPEVLFTRSEDDITVTYALFDSNLDVTRARYEFLNGSGQVVAGPFDIDLTSSINSANLLKGQSFIVEQRFTGASSNPEATSVRVTVFDGETNITDQSTTSAVSTNAAGVQLLNRTRRVTLFPPSVALRP